MFLPLYGRGSGCRTSLALESAGCGSAYAPRLQSAVVVSGVLIGYLNRPLCGDPTAKLPGAVHLAAQVDQKREAVPVARDVHLDMPQIRIVGADVLTCDRVADAVGIAAELAHESGVGGQDGGPVVRLERGVDRLDPAGP